MHGRVRVGGADVGGGTAVTPDAVITASHVLPVTVDGAAVTFVPVGNEAAAVDVESLERDEVLDLALLRLSRPVAPSYVADAAAGDIWQIAVGPRPDDPYLSGVVDYPGRDYEDGRGRRTMVQLRVWQEVKGYQGFSGSGVVLPAADNALAAVLTLEQEERTPRRPGAPRPGATNVLYAVPIRSVLQRFGLAAASRRPALPGDTAVANFLARVLGTPDRPVPFGGRMAELDLLDRGWRRAPSALCSPRPQAVASRRCSLSGSPG